MIGVARRALRPIMIHEVAHQVCSLLQLFFGLRFTLSGCLILAWIPTAPGQRGTFCPLTNIALALGRALHMARATGPARKAPNGVW